MIGEDFLESLFVCLGQKDDTVAKAAIPGKVRKHFVRARQHDEMQQYFFLRPMFILCSSRIEPTAGRDARAMMDLW